MSDTEHAFDPNWPHGHDVLFPDGRRTQVRIVSLISACPGNPIVAEWEGGVGRWEIRRFNTLGRQSGYGLLRLINRPAPEPVMVAGTKYALWMHDNTHKHAARIEVTCEWLSDGTARAKAEVVE